MNPPNPVDSPESDEPETSEPDTQLDQESRQENEKTSYIQGQGTG